MRTDSDDRLLQETTNYILLATFHIELATYLKQ